MFDNITLNDYNFGFQLHQSQFLIDSLYPNVTFHLDCNDHFHIYRDNSYISQEELIFYIHMISIQLNIIFNLFGNDFGSAPFNTGKSPCAFMF